MNRETSLIGTVMKTPELLIYAIRYDQNSFHLYYKLKSETPHLWYSHPSSPKQDQKLKVAKCKIQVVQWQCQKHQAQKGTNGRGKEREECYFQAFQGINDHP